MQLRIKIEMAAIKKDEVVTIEVGVASIQTETIDMVVVATTEIDLIIREVVMEVLETVAETTGNPVQEEEEMIADVMIAMVTMTEEKAAVDIISKIDHKPPDLMIEISNHSQEYTQKMNKVNSRKYIVHYLRYSMIFNIIHI